MKLNFKPSKLILNEKRHTYTLGEQLVPGVTTILDVKAKDFLKWWTVKEMYRFMLDKQKDIQKMSAEEYIQLLEDGKSAHTRKTTQAADSGKLAHKWIEHYIKDKMNPGMVALNPMLPEDKAAVNAINAFLEWEKQHNIEWLASELLVYSERHTFAGTIDAVAVINGVTTLIDFKTSNQISEEYYLQTAAYQLALEEMLEDDMKIEARLIIRIPKDGGQVEPHEVKTDLQFDRDTFIRLREIHKWNIYIQNNFNPTKYQLKK